jgi:acyl-CoA thioesterase
VGPSAYAADIGPEWNCPIVPQGGMVLATAARAMETELGDEAQRLRSISMVFAAQVRAGEVDIDVSLLRRGRSMSQCTATLRNPGSEAGATAIAVFGSARRGFEFVDIAPPPGIPPPNECPSFRDPPPDHWPINPDRPMLAFWEQIEGRPALGHAPWDDYSPESSLRAYWYRFDEPAVLDDGRWDPLAIVAMCDTMPGAVGERLGYTEEDWIPPSADITVHVFSEDARSEWILGVNRARWAGHGYASVDMEMWDMDRSEPLLVAYATQVMFFQFLKPQS